MLLNDWLRLFRTSSRRPSSRRARRRWIEPPAIVCRAERLEDRTLLSVVAAKVDGLSSAGDVNGNGNVDPGDTLTYTVTLENPTSQSAAGVAFSDSPDPNTSLVVGSVTTTAGTVTSGNTAGQTSVGVDVGTMSAGGTVTITFNATVNGSLPSNVTEVSNQGIVAEPTPVNTPTLGQCYNTSASSNLPLGQEFSPTTDFVSYVDLHIEDAGSDIGPGANLQVVIHSGTITGTVLGTSETVFVPDGTNTGGGNTITRFNFATPVAVTPSTLTVFEIEQLAPISGGNGNFAMCGGPASTSTYSSGRAIIDGIPQTNFDFWFRIGGGTPSDDPDVGGTADPTVTPLGSGNHAPVADNQTVTIDEDNIASGQLTASDADGDTLTYAKASNPSNGVASVNAAGQFLYIPSPNFFGTDSFTFTVSDGALSDTGSVTINVQPVNDAPFVDQPTVMTDEDTPVSSQIDYLEVEGDPVTFGLESAASNGTAQVNADGSFTYTPDADFFGTDTFDFRATDDQGAFRVGTVTVEVAPVNDAPVAQDDDFSVDEEQTLTITVSPVTSLHMDSQPGDFIGQGLTYDFTPATAAFSADRNFDNGVSLDVDPTALGEFWFLDFAAPFSADLTPGVYEGATRFPFQAADEPGLDVSGNGRGSNTLTGRFVVREADYDSNGDVLRFAADFDQHSEGADPALFGRILFNSLVGAQGGVLQNDSDVDGDLLTVALVDGPQHGSLTLNLDGSLEYSPDADFFGTDSFTYKTGDGLLDSNVATVTITVNNVNDAPVATGQSAATDEDTALSGNVVASDVDGDSLSYSAVQTAAHGQLALNDDGSFTYTPDADFFGSDSFTFKANDGTADSNVATVSITVNPVNDPPVANGQSATTDEDTALNGSVTGNDVEGDPLTFSLVQQAANGTAVVNPDGTFQYTPNANFNGFDSFTFKANDGDIDSNAATVSITVDPVNDPPVVNDQSFSIAENSTNGTSVATIAASDPDAGDTLTFAVTGGSGQTAFAVNSGTGEITVADTGQLDYETTTSFTLNVTVTDAGGLTDTAIVTVNLTDVDESVPVVIDIAPGDDTNTINIKSDGKIEVAILSTATFDALTVDVNSLTFGRTGSEDSLSRNPHSGVPRYRIEDVNGDGRLDIVVKFEIALTDFQIGDTAGVLQGSTLDGKTFDARQYVAIRQPGKKK